MSELKGRAAEDLGLADHVAALRRREEVRHRRADGEALRGGKQRGDKVAGQPIRVSSPSTACVSRSRTAPGLGAASSNKPELGGGVESPVSEARMRDMFKAGRRGCWRTHPEVGAYNQTI